MAQPKPGQEPPRFEARLYDVLFSSQNPGAAEDWLTDLNPASLEMVEGAFANPVLAAASAGDRWAVGGSPFLGSGFRAVGRWPGSNGGRRVGLSDARPTWPGFGWRQEPGCCGGTCRYPEEG